MRDSINNFIDLLVKGDSFLIFLVIMLVIIIGVIVCLVKIQMNDKEYYEDEDESEEAYEEVLTPNKEVTPNRNTRESLSETKDAFPRFVAPREENDEMPRFNLKDKMREAEAKYEAKTETEESTFTYKEPTYKEPELLKYERPFEKKEEPIQERYIPEPTIGELEEEYENKNTFELPARKIEQSRFNFEENVNNAIEEEEKEETLVRDSYNYEETSDKVDDLIRSSFAIEDSINEISEMNNESVPYNNLQSPEEFDAYEKPVIEREMSNNYAGFSEERGLPIDNYSRVNTNFKDQMLDRYEKEEYKEPLKEELDPISEYEREQEEKAIISASELESRINNMKNSGEFEAHKEELRKYEREEEQKAIISYEELLSRASEGKVSYESEENIGGISVGKVDTKQIESYSETNDKPYYKEEAFLEAMKEFRRAL